MAGEGNGRSATITNRDVYESVAKLNLEFTDRMARLETMFQGSERRFESLERTEADHGKRLDLVEAALAEIRGRNAWVPVVVSGISALVVMLIARAMGL